MALLVLLKRIAGPHDRALLHGMAASIFVNEGNDRQAEADYLAAVTALEQAGENQGADFAVLIEGLGKLYMRRKRFEDARQAFDRALAIFSAAKDTVPLDFIIFLHLRAELHVKLSEWADADADLTRALRLGSSAPNLEPALSESLFRSYAVVLRNTHRRREARNFEAHADAVRAHQRRVVDVSELLSRK